MNNLRRLLEGEADGLEREMLEAGRGDRPSTTRRRRIALGLGVGAAMSAASTAKASALGATEWLSHLVRAPWAISGTVGVAAIALGVSVWPKAEVSAPSVEAPKPALVAMAPSSLVPSAIDLDQLPLEETSEPAPRRPSSTSGRGAASAGPARSTPTLSEEVALLENARRALVRGAPRQTLALLDEHAQRFKRPRLSTEGSVLRIEALVASGERARAANLGKDFLSKNVKGPYERRVRSLIGDERNPSGRSR